jgi:hypothetical protein
VNKRIADEFGMAERTVNAQLVHLMVKPLAKSTAQLGALAERRPWAANSGYPFRQLVSPEGPMVSPLLATTIG